MLNRPQTFPVILIALLATSLASCDHSSAHREFEAAAALPPAGITPMDADGNPTGPADPDDWRSSPLFPSINVQPAYPNPVPIGFAAAVSIPVSIPFDNVIAGGLHLITYNPRIPNPIPVTLDYIPPEALFEFVELRFTRDDLRVALQLASPTGLYRVFIQDGAGRLVSYGDIRID